MIYVYDASIMGCCNRREAVRRLIARFPRSDYKLKHTRTYRGTIRPDAHVVYTDDTDITTGYEAAGVPVMPIGPDNLNSHGSTHNTDQV